jgi:hypothetical protein
VPVGFTSIRIVVDIDADSPKERIDRLGELTERYCVVSQTLKHPPAIAAFCSHGTGRRYRPELRHPKAVILRRSEG